MTVRTYYSTDASAPVLNGQAGSLIAVLDACLVNGYGAKAAAGWAKEFAGTNLAAYRAATGNRLRLRVDDSIGGNARVVGYESMSDVNTGTGPFPTAVQLSGGGFVYKSAGTASVAVAWAVVATGTMVYLICNQTISSTTVALDAAAAAGCTIFAFGDIASFKAGDAFGTVIICGVTATNAGEMGTIGATPASTAAPGHYLARSFTQAGGSVPLVKLGDGEGNMGGATATVTAALPNPVTGGLDIAPIRLAETNAAIVRGILPGIWLQGHGSDNAAVGDALTIYNGSGDMAGKSFQVFKAKTNGIIVYRLLLEVSDTW